MKLIPSLLLFISLFVGSLFLLYAGAHVAAESYEFWKYGIEAEGTVLSLEDIYNGRGGNTYYYKVAIQDEEYVDGFSYELSAGDTITVLVMPETPDKMVLADEESSLFEIYSSMMGGWYWGVLAAALEVFIFGMAIVSLICIWHVFWRITLNE